MRFDELLQNCTIKLSLSGNSSWGTGFVVAPGLILTCFHVVSALSAGTTRQVKWHQGKSAGVARLLQVSSEVDLALLAFSLDELSDLID